MRLRPPKRPSPRQRRTALASCLQHIPAQGERHEWHHQPSGQGRRRACGLNRRPRRDDLGPKRAHREPPVVPASEPLPRFVRPPRPSSRPTVQRPRPRAPQPAGFPPPPTAPPRSPPRPRSGPGRPTAPPPRPALGAPPPARPARAPAVPTPRAGRGTDRPGARRLRARPAADTRRAALPRRAPARRPWTDLARSRPGGIKAERQYRRTHHGESANSTPQRARADRRRLQSATDRLPQRLRRRTRTRRRGPRRCRCAVGAGPTQPAKAQAVAARSVRRRHPSRRSSAS